LLQRLLDHAQSERANFRVSGVGYSGEKRVDLTRRRSSKLKLSGELRDELEVRARAPLPEIFQQLGATPFEPGKFELEMVAHGDGAFYVRHRDVVFAQSGPTNRRVVSAVYYFHKMPK
jgi:SM-20-related protein